MRHQGLRVLVLTALAALTPLGIVSCGENTPPAANSSGSSTGSLAASPAVEAPRRQLPPPPGGALAAALPPAGTAQNTATAAPGAAARPAAPAPVPAGDVIPPKDAEWTILCYTVRGPGHIEQANELKQGLATKTGRREWYAIHGSEGSNLYFGFYRTIANAKNARDAAEVERSRKDREMIAKLEMLVETGSGRELARPFERCAFVELAAPDPSSRPEWNLANVDRDKHPKDDTRAFWTLQVMAFRGFPDRKEAAVQVVEELRKEGLPAYYYHGESVSSVCVGAWPRTALKEQRSDGGPREKGEKPLARSDQALLVTPESLPPQMVPKKLDGQEVVAVAPALEVVDPTLKEMIKRFPDHAVNGEYVVHHTRSGGKIRDPSFLVMIPRPRGNGYYDYDEGSAEPLPIAGNQGNQSAVSPTGSQQVGAQGMQPTRPQPATPGLGRLRRVGEN